MGGQGREGQPRNPLRNPLHFSDSAWAAQHMNQTIVILKCKHGFRGFTPLPLEGLIVDSQQKGKEKKRESHTKKSQEFRRLTKNCFNLTKHVSFDSGFKINLLHY